LEYFKNTLPQKHTNLFKKISKTEFENGIDKIASKAEQLNYETFTAELFKLVVSIGDEHTRIEPTYTMILPIKFEIYKEGIFAIGVDSNALGLLPAKLIAINNHPMEEIIRRCKTVIQNENRSYFEVYLLHFLNNPSFLKGINVIENVDSASFTVLSKGNQVTTVNLRSVAKGAFQSPPLCTPFKNAFANKHKDFYWYEYNAETKAIYFNYNTCRMQENLSFDKFNQTLFATIDSYKPERIIVDLRGNSGGNSAILQPFMDSIKNSYLNKTGKLFVLIGKKTFSSAVMNAVTLKRNTNAILVGEPTSGNINHYGEVRSFRLPRTGILIGYSTKYWENWKGKTGPLLPDKKVTYSINDLKNNIDPAISIIYGNNKSRLY
jgi:hypothetical protein